MMAELIIHAVTGVIEGRKRGEESRAKIREERDDPIAEMKTEN